MGRPLVGLLVSSLVLWGALSEPVVELNSQASSLSADGDTLTLVFRYHGWGGLEYSASALVYAGTTFTSPGGESFSLPADINISLAIPSPLDADRRVLYLDYLNSSIRLAQEAQSEGPCPPGKQCAVCDGQLRWLEHKESDIHVYKPQLPPPKLTCGPRDGSLPQNYKVWTLQASLSAGGYQVGLQWGNVWWNRSATVTYGELGIQGSPVADFEDFNSAALLEDALPSNLSTSYLVLIPGKPFETAWPGSLVESQYVGPGANQLGITEEAFVACAMCGPSQAERDCVSVKSNGSNGSAVHQLKPFGGVDVLLTQMFTAAINSTGLNRTCQFLYNQNIEQSIHSAFGMNQTGYAQFVACHTPGATLTLKFPLSTAALLAYASSAPRYEPPPAPGTVKGQRVMWTPPPPWKSPWAWIPDNYPRSCFDPQYGFPVDCGPNGVIEISERCCKCNDGWMTEFAKYEMHCTRRIAGSPSPPLRPPSPPPWPPWPPGARPPNPPIGWWRGASPPPPPPPPPRVYRGPMPWYKKITPWGWRVIGGTSLALLTLIACCLKPKYFLGFFFGLLLGLIKLPFQLSFWLCSGRARQEAMGKKAKKKEVEDEEEDEIEEEESHGHSSGRRTARRRTSSRETEGSNRSSEGGGGRSRGGSSSGSRGSSSSGGSDDSEHSQRQRSKPSFLARTLSKLNGNKGPGHDLEQGMDSMIRAGPHPPTAPAGHVFGGPPGAPVMNYPPGLPSFPPAPSPMMPGLNQPLPGGLPPQQQALMAAQGPPVPGAFQHQFSMQSQPAMGLPPLPPRI